MSISTHKAFTIKECNKMKCSGSKQSKESGVFNTELGKLCVHNLILNSEISMTTLPWLTFYTNLKNEKSTESYNKSVSSTPYSITKSEHAQIDFKEFGYSLTDEFINDFESATDSNLTYAEKLNKLKEIIEKYGQFYSKRVIFGDIIVEQPKHNEDLGKYNHTFYFFIFCLRLIFLENKCIIKW